MFNYQMPTYQPMFQQQTTYMPAVQNVNVVWVQNQNEVNNYAVAPGNRVLLMDENESVFYIKSADMNGNMTTKVYDFVERDGNKRTYVTFDEMKDYVNEVMKNESSVSATEQSV